MLTEGYCHLHRKILKYFTKPYSEINAWIWMITQAEWRNGDSHGKVITTTRQLGVEWGVDKATVSRWFKKWMRDGRITCDFAEFHRQAGASSPHATKSATKHVLKCATRVSEITLVNYTQYQTQPEKCATRDATKRATKDATLLNKKKEALKDKNLLVGETRLPKKLQIELIRQEIGIREKEYPYLNILLEFKKWNNWMEATGKFPKNYQASWNNWLIKAEEIRLEKSPKKAPSKIAQEFGLDD